MTQGRGAPESAPNNTWLWWSTGKDSAWALRALRQSEDTEVTGLVTTVTSTFDRVSMHGVRTSVLDAQAQAVGLPVLKVLIPYPCTNEQYEAALEPAFRAAESAGVSSMAFGDLFLKDVKAYREDLFTGSRLRPAFPLWGRDTRLLANEMVSGGLKAYLTCVDSAQLSTDFAGRAYNAQLLAELPDSVDPCGENGEFHTCVVEGPMFSRDLSVRVGEVVERDDFVFADLLLEGGGVGWNPS